MSPRDQISMRFDPADLAAADEIAKAEGRTRSDVLRRLVHEAITAREAAAAKKK